MQNLSKRIQNLSESQTIAMAQKSRELTAQGRDIINLSLGEPDFNTPDFIKEAAKQAIDNNFSHYMPVPGYLDLREAISLKFKRDNNITYAPNQIVVSTGAKQAIANAVMCLIDEGDEVLLPAPFWVTYKEIVKMAGGVPVIMPTLLENDFKATPTDLEKYITAKTKMVIFSSPCNPTGSVYAKSELKGIAELLSEKGIYVISDEIYEHINFVSGHESIAQFDFMYDKTITVNGVSKAFAMTGWRIGYIGAPQWISDACTKMQGQFTSGTSSIAQRAALAAVSANPEVTIPMKEAFLKRRNMVLEMMKDIPGMKANIPEGAFYVFPDVSAFFGKSTESHTINNPTDLSMYLLEKANVATVTGEAFGNENCLRFSYTNSDEKLKEAMVRMKTALAKLS